MDKCRFREYSKLWFAEKERKEMVWGTYRYNMKREYCAHKRSWQQIDIEYCIKKGNN